MPSNASLPTAATNAVFISYGAQPMAASPQSMSKPSKRQAQGGRPLYHTSQPKLHRRPGHPELRSQLNLEIQGATTVLANQSSHKVSVRKQQTVYRYSAWQTGPALESLPRPASALDSGASCSSARTSLPESTSLPTASPRPVGPTQTARGELWQHKFVEELLTQTLLELADILSLNALNCPLNNVRPVVNQYRTQALVLWKFSAVSDLKGKTFSVSDLAPEYLFKHWEASLLLTPDELAIVEKELSLLSWKCGLRAH